MQFGTQFGKLLLEPGDTVGPRGVDAPIGIAQPAWLGRQDPDLDTWPR